MALRLVTVGAFLAAPFLGACGSRSANVPSDGSLAAGDASTTSRAGGPSGLPCDVDAVVRTHCQTCHASSPQFGAPMPLVTYDDLTAPARSDASKKVYELMKVRLRDTQTPMPPPPNAALAVSDLGAIDAWIGQGVPKNDGACASGSDGDGGGAGVKTGPLTCTPDLTVKPTAAYAMVPSEADRYACYSFDVTADAKRWITGIAPRVDNGTIVHHVLLYQVPGTTNVPTTVTPCNPGGGTGYRLVYAWAPGGVDLTMPENVGFPLEGTTRYVVQVHYSNLNHLAGQSDASGFALCTTATPRTYDADVLAFGTTRINVPARGTLDETCDLTIPAQYDGLHVISAFPHMHKLGTTIQTVQKRAAGGDPVDLGKQLAWSFGSQPWFPIDSVLHTNDIVSTRCAWNNTTDAPVTFGEKTENEMCYSFTIYYPKITSPRFSWMIPSVTSSCHKTP